MSDDFFGGSFGGDITKIANDTRLECKICWYVYDPAEGDEYWQIAPGTPFAALPDHWSCPECDSSKNDFMVLEAATDQ
ncbi:MAG: rubredoxin [Pseudomonadota bacterium]